MEVFYRLFKEKWVLVSTRGQWSGWGVRTVWGEEIKYTGGWTRNHTIGEMRMNVQLLQLCTVKCSTNATSETSIVNQKDEITCLVLLNLFLRIPIHFLEHIFPKWIFPRTTISRKCDYKWKVVFPKIQFPENHFPKILSPKIFPWEFVSRMHLNKFLCTIS